MYDNAAIAAVPAGAATGALFAPTAVAIGLALVAAVALVLAVMLAVRKQRLEIH